jgi:hypothetical protein
MDAIFLLIAVALWLLIAGMAWGSQRLSGKRGDKQ